MNKKININPSSTKWLEKDDRVVADYFCDLGFRSLKQILDMRVFDLMNMQGLNAVRVEEVIICLYKWLNPNTAIDEAMPIGKFGGNANRAMSGLRSYLHGLMEANALIAAE